MACSSLIVSTHLVLGGTASLVGAERVHGFRFDPEEPPWWWTRRRRAVFGGQRIAVDLCGPTLPAKRLGHGLQLRCVGDSHGATLHDQVETYRGDAEDALRIGRDVARLSRTRARIEVQDAVKLNCPERPHVGRSVRIRRRQPRRVAVGTTGAGRLRVVSSKGLAHPLPFDDRQVIPAEISLGNRHVSIDRDAARNSSTGRDCADHNPGKQLISGMHGGGGGAGGPGGRPAMMTGSVSGALGSK